MTAYSGIHIRMQTKGNYTTEDSDTTPDIGQSAITANRVGQAPPSSGCVVSNYTQISATVTDWPQAAADIANAAGLEAAYKPLLTKVPATPPYDYLK